MIIQRALKRMMDIGAALVLLILCAPVMAVTALAVHMALGAPVLFCQQRPGKGGRMFMLYKFRSMRDAQDGAGNLLDDAQRLPAFGRWLRSTSLDELPELWNILKGDMSLIGPRPLLPEYLPFYSATEQRRHDVTPGLTGWAQIKGRNALSWDERLALDVWYVDHWSLWLDLKIILATFGVVFSRHGVQAKGHATMPRFDDYARTYRKQMP